MTNGCNLWGFTSEENILKIERLQKKCVRILSFAPFNSHTNQLFIDLNLIKVRDLISINRLKLVYDFLNNRLPDDLTSLFSLTSDIHTTSRDLKSSINKLIYIPSFKTITYGKDSLRYQCAKLWNTIFKTGEIQVEADKLKKLAEIKTINKFKEAIKKYYLYSYTVVQDIIYY